MEPLNDNELRDLLQKWEAPAVPSHLERRIFGKPRHHAGFRWLLSGSIRIPVPVFVLLLVCSALIYILPRERQAAPASAREVSPPLFCT